MFTKAELVDAINEIATGKHSIQNCERLAAIYTVLDHLYDEPTVEKPDFGYSYDNKVEVETTIGNYGNSDFLRMVSGKPARDVWRLINELVEAIGVFNPRLMDNFIDKLNEI